MEKVDFDLQQLEGGKTLKNSLSPIYGLSVKSDLSFKMPFSNFLHFRVIGFPSA